ncbi:hypothetical protein PDIDSM_5278 [Penicillium digitatum]|nr:hypothetical protein PDIDSM_5278 [Penicillium digitatum]
MELRDLVTQKSVIQRANMAAVMRNYRDRVVLTVERKSCLAAELRRSHASEDLFWAISVLEGLHMAINIDQLSVQSEAVKSIREAMACIDDVQQYLNRWALNGLEVR